MIRRVPLPLVKEKVTLFPSTTPVNDKLVAGIVGADCALAFEKLEINKNRNTRYRIENEFLTI